jgi:hypothetical protein
MDMENSPETGACFSPSMTLKIFQSDVPKLQPDMLETVVETMECLESFAFKYKL